MGRGAEIVSADSFIGERVLNGEGEELGRVEELMIEPHSGRIAYAILTLGGIFGMGEKLFAIPWGRLQFQSDNHTLLLDMEKENLKNAPSFDRHSWPEMTEESWGEEVHRYYGQLAYWQEYFGEKTTPRQSGGHKNPSSFQH